MAQLNAQGEATYEISS